MSLLNDLANLFHHHSQQPVNAQPVQPTQAPQLQTQPQQSPANLGVPYSDNISGVQLPQGNQYNPGYSPLQNTQTPNPQVRNGNPFQPQYNPQDNSNQQYWLP